MLNKEDTLTTDDADRTVAALQELQPNKPVLKVSALRGDGLDDWLNMPMSNAPVGSHILHDIDYDTYAKGEAVLGWFNAAVQLRGRFYARQFAEALMRKLQTAFAARNAEVAHLKFLLTSGTQMLQGHLSKVDAEPTFVGELGEIDEATLVLNARVALPPELVGGIAIQAVMKAGKTVNIETEILSLQSFSPPYPRAPYQLSEPV